jgi:hypothetical protein
MASPDIIDLVAGAMTEYNNTRDYSLAMTAATFAAQAGGGAINEAPGLPFDPVTGTTSITAASLRWKHFWQSLFETTTHTLILMYQQSMDLNRAKIFVSRLRNYVQYQDGPVFNQNQIA